MKIINGSGGPRGECARVCVYVCGVSERVLSK